MGGFLHNNLMEVNEDGKGKDFKSGVMVSYGVLFHRGLNGLKSLIFDLHFVSLYPSPLPTELKERVIRKFTRPFGGRS